MSGCFFFPSEIFASTMLGEFLNKIFVSSVAKESAEQYFYIMAGKFILLLTPPFFRVDGDTEMFSGVPRVLRTPTDAGTGCSRTLLPTPSLPLSTLRMNDRVTLPLALHLNRQAALQPPIKPKKAPSSIADRIATTKRYRRSIHPPPHSRRNQRSRSPLALYLNRQAALQPPTKLQALPTPSSPSHLRPSALEPPLSFALSLLHPFHSSIG